MGKRILMMGAGAIGGYAGGWMVKAGEDVTFVDAWPAHVEAMRKNGLSLRGLTPEETTTVPVRALHVCDVPQLVNEKPFDVIFIAVKSYDTEWATTMVKPLLAPDGFCVSLQNCINEERIAAIVGWGRTMGCIVSLLACELVEAGRVIRTVPMGGEKHTVFRVGEPHGRVTPRAQAVAQLMRHIDSAKVTNNLWGERWSKLVINAMRNGLSAATGMRGNARDLNETTRWLSIRLGSQCVRVGQALGFQLEKMLGMDPEMMGLAGEGNRDALAEIVDKLVEGSKKRSDEQRPSMAQDIHKGRRTEIDYINGFVYEKGLEIGINADLHLKLRDIVRKVESRSVQASPDLVAGL